MDWLCGATGLCDEEVHVWHLPWSTDWAEFDSPQTVLSADEKARAARFHFQQDRAMYCRCRTLLRQLLEAYGVAPAEQIEFAYSLTGKPRLDEKHHLSRLKFNLSHTRNMAAFAFARTREVGIDVEEMRPVADADSIVATLFAPEEQAEYWELPPAARPIAFLNGWTRKEALLKATGVGLGDQLDQFAVSLAPGEPARIVRRAVGSLGSVDWTLADVSLVPSHIAALAVSGPEIRVQNRIWTQTP